MLNESVTACLCAMLSVKTMSHNLQGILDFMVTISIWGQSSLCYPFMLLFSSHFQLFSHLVTSVLNKLSVQKVWAAAWTHLFAVMTVTNAVMYLYCCC